MNYMFFNKVDPEASTEEEADRTAGSTLVCTEEDTVISEENIEKSEDENDEFEGNNVTMLSMDLMRKNNECNLLSKQLFEKSQLLKVLQDRVHQLENEKRLWKKKIEK